MSHTSPTPPNEAPHDEALKSLNSQQRQLILEMQQELGIPLEEVESMLEAVLRGESVSEYYGYTPEICNSIEHTALTYYRSGRYDLAAQIFAWLVDVTGGTRGSGWRGMAACYQATRDFDRAIQAYRRALLADPDDVLSEVFCGECLCHTGAQQEGLAMLQRVLDAPSNAKSNEPHFVRARAIIEAQSKRPASKPTAQTSDAKPASAAQPPSKPKGKTAAVVEAGIDAAVAKEVMAHSYDDAMQKVMADPALKAQLEQLTDAVRNRQLTLKEVADFSDEQMDAGYAVACQFLERGDAVKALETVGWLLWVDSRDGRFYQLAGICMHHLKLWCIADFLYSLALTYGGQQAATLVYQGEAKIMLDEKTEAKELLSQGVQIATGQADLHDILVRGRFLLKQLSA